MRKKLEGNGLWESSRMMLPEHVKTLQASNDEYFRPDLPRPVLDEQEMELIAGALQRSIQEREVVRLRMYDPREQLIIEGIVDRVDMAAGRFVVDGERFRIEDIIGVD